MPEAVSFRRIRGFQTAAPEIFAATFFVDIENY
jgi:hypothetical protein